ncbi:MAG: hypothetical protein J7M16_14265 [Anaerolineae bacterium]|nr:hypothetical protein [Anaerolineae bacterium]
MNLQDRVEWLIEQVVDGEWEDTDNPDFHRMRTEGYIADADVAIPYSWMLCAKGLPQARSELRQAITEMRQALDGLETLLDAVDAAEEEAVAQGHPEWAPLIALLKAPFPLEKPEIYDPGDVFNIAVMLRDTLFDGDWERHIAWIETQGGPAQRDEDLPLTRSLQEFEQSYGVNLSDLLFSEQDCAEHEQLRKRYAQRPR